MGKNATRRRRRSTLVLAAALACGCSPADSDPPPSAQSALQEPLRASDAPPLLTCKLELTDPVPAPVGESAPRTELAPRPRIDVALGRTASAWVDPGVLQSFAVHAGDSTHQISIFTERDAVEMMMVARAGFALIGGQLSERDVRAGLRQTRVAVELYALAVAAESPLRSLSRIQLRQIFTGQVSHWHQLGCNGEAIVAVVPSDPTLAERANHSLMPGDAFASTCVRVASNRHVADQILQNKGAIGIVRVTDEPLLGGQKLLQIDWSPPTIEAFGYGTYPFGTALHLVTSGPPRGEAQQFLDFAHTDDGRELLRRSLLIAR